MPDLNTVVTSVLATLAVQSAYLLLTKLPGQMHKSKSALAKLDVREKAEYSMLKRINEEVHAADQKFDDWFEHFKTCAERPEGVPIDRAYFLDILPQLSSQLGRLQGLSTPLNKYYPIDPLPDFIWLYEQARRISKNLASYALSSEVDFNFELSEFALFKSRVTARLEQMPHELDIAQSDFKIELSNLEAELIDLKSQFRTVGFFMSIAIFFLSRPIIQDLFAHSRFRDRASVGGVLFGTIVATLAYLPLWKLYRKEKNHETNT